MKRLLSVVVLFVLCVFVLPQVAEAQMGMGMRGPSMRGVWKPVVGSGAVYQMESKREGKQEMEVAIVGAETSEGKPGHWMEMVMQSKGEGQVVMRTLFAMDGKELRTLRMVMQQGDEEPMEISMEMMGMMGQQQKPQKSDVREEAERVGTETITTPAGTFECDHWRAKDKSADYWVTDKVSPWGMVKMTSKDETMTLVRVVSNAKTKIRGTPRKMEDIMRRP